MRRIFTIIILALTLFNCSSTKNITKAPLKKGIDLTFENSNYFALSIKGKGKIDIYDKKLVVTILKSEIKLNSNSKFDNRNWNVENISFGIARKTNPFTGGWEVFYNSKKQTINKNISRKSDILDLSNYIFEIPFNDITELENAWIAITIFNGTGSWNYSHSKDKKQNFGLESINVTQIDYSIFTTNELKQKHHRLQLELNHNIFKEYIEHIENSNSKMPYKAMENPEIDSLWANNPKLKILHNQWKQSAAEAYSFKVKNCPGYNENLKSYQNKSITLDEYYKNHREMVSKLRIKFPEKYDSLLKTSLNNQKKLWLMTCRFLLNEYRNKENSYPINWISEEKLEFLKSSRYCKKLDIELNTVEQEIIKRI